MGLRRTRETEKKNWNADCLRKHDFFFMDFFCNLALIINERLSEWVLLLTTATTHNKLSKHFRFKNNLSEKS